MRALIVLAAAGIGLSACAPDPTLPTRPYQWQERQERIEREFNARRELCRTLDPESERFARECPRPTGDRS